MEVCVEIAGLEPTSLRYQRSVLTYLLYFSNCGRTVKLPSNRSYFKLTTRGSNSDVPINLSTGYEPEGIEVSAANTGFEPVISPVTGERPLRAGPISHI